MICLKYVFATNYIYKIRNNANAIVNSLWKQAAGSLSGFYTRISNSLRHNYQHGKEEADVRCRIELLTLKPWTIYVRIC